jgi:hypothetical protein
MLFLHGGVLCPIEIGYALSGLVIGVPFLRYYYNKIRARLFSPR